MSCTIVENEGNKIIGVQNKEGGKSKLFERINANPLLSTAQAIEAYKNVYSDKFIGNDESQVLYKNPAGEFFSSYQDALINTLEGEIQGVVAGQTFFTVNANTNSNTFEGQINNLVRKRILTGEKYLDVDGIEKHSVEGASHEKKAINGEIVKTEARSTFGLLGVTQLESGDFIFEQRRGNLYTPKAGEKQVIKTSEVLEMTYDDMSKFDDPLALVTVQAYTKTLPAFTDLSPYEDTINFLPENELQQALLKTLKDMGVKTVSMANYVSKYASRNGVDPSSEALADIANQVIAFKNGEIAPEVLTEETAHFIIEALNQEDLTDLLRNINKTAEWREFAEHYYEVYSKEYSAEELEQVVRKEILGKVLANSLQARFTQQVESQTEKSIINRLLDLFTGFIERVEAYFTPTSEKNLQDFSIQIYQKLMDGTLGENLDTSGFQDNKYKLYKLSSAVNSEAERIRRTAERSITLLESQGYRLNRRDVRGRSQIETVKQSVDKIVGIDTLNEIELMASIGGIASIAQSQTRYLNRAVEKNKGQKYHFSSEEQSVYHSMNADFARMLSEMNILIDDSTPDRKELKKEIRSTLQQISDLQGKVGISQGSAIDKIASEYAEKMSLTAEQENSFKEALNGVQKDTNFIFAYLGQLVNAKSAFLGLAAEVSSRLYAQQRMNFQSVTKKFLSNLEKIGFDPTKLSMFKKGGYIENIHDNEKMNSAITDEKFRLFQEQLTLLPEEIAEPLRKLTKDTFSINLLPAKNQYDFNKKYKKWADKEFNESFFTKEERERREALMQGYSEVTVAWEQDSRSAYGDIMSQADKVDGRTVVTKELKTQIEDLKKERVKKKNIFTADGQLKLGLSYTDEAIGKDVIEIGKLKVKIDRNNTDNSSIIAFELNQIDASGVKTGDVKSGVSQAFKDYLQTLPEEEKLDFLFLNSYIGFSEDYYNQFKDNSSVSQKLQDEFEKTGDESLRILIQEINETAAKLQNILKANKVLNQPSEVNYQAMSKQPGGEVSQVKQLVEIQQSLYREANAILGEKEFEENTATENNTNNAWQEHLADSGAESFDEIMTEILSNVSSNSKLNIENAKTFMNNFLAGKRVEIPTNSSYIFTLEVDDYNAMSLEDRREYMQEELINYSQSRLLPYFKRSSPAGYTSMMTDLQTGFMSVEQFLENYENGNYDFLTVTPNFSFQDMVVNDKLNPVFEHNMKNNLPQYRVREADGSFNKYVSQEYIQKYGIQIDENGAEKATKDLKNYEARKALLDYHKESLDAYGVLGSHNIYQLPQKEKGQLKKFTEIVKKGGLKEVISEAVNYREDDADFGQTASGGVATGKSMRSDVIPKYGLNKLEKQDNVTDELLYSYTWMAQQSYLYKSRVENIGDLLAINSYFESNHSDAKNTYKMLQANLEYNMYGSKESIDDAGQFTVLGVKSSAGAIAKTFTSWVRLVNLGFNVIVPATSAITGGVQLSIERIVGERVDAVAYNKANLEASKLMSPAAAEIGGLFSKARLNVLGEMFGIYGDTERFENSNLGKFGRVLGRTPYVMHEMGNFPIIPRVMLAVLYDHKIVGGQLQNYRQFKDRNRTLSDKEARAEWKNYSSIYDTLDTVDGVASFNKQKIADLRGTNEDEDRFITNMHQVITNRITLATSEIDGAISPEMKSIAARNAYFTAFLLHRSWLAIAIQKRIKGIHTNTYSGFDEEGVYMTLPRMASMVLKDWRNNGKPFVDSLKENWSNVGEQGKKNIKRMLIEMAVVNGVIGFAAMLANGLDDPEEDSLLEVAAEYLVLRTANEMQSSTTVRGLAGELYGVLSSTIVGLDKANVILDGQDAFSSEIIQRGKYKGLSERERWFYKYFPIAKETFSLNNLQETRNTYFYYNQTKDDKLKYTLYHWLTDKQ